MKMKKILSLTLILLMLCSILAASFTTAQAVAIKKLGGNVTFIGAVGQDANANTLTNTLSELHISFDGFCIAEHSTGVAIITVVDADNYILLHPGANNALTPDRIDAKRDLIKNCDYLVLQLEIPLESVVRACEIASEYNVKVVLNPAPYKELPGSLLALVDYLIPNEHEAYALTGIYPGTKDTTALAIKKLQQMGASNVIITLGENGCAYTSDSEIRFTPALPTNAVDTTSAGDSFIGGFITKLADGASIDDAIHFGTRVAAVTVSRHGAAASIPFASEMEEL